MVLDLKRLNKVLSMVAHICNPSYKGGNKSEDHSLRLAGGRT
jgi:hypothetical protein